MEKCKCLIGSMCTLEGIMLCRYYSELNITKYEEDADFKFVTFKEFEDVYTPFSFCPYCGNNKVEFNFLKLTIIEDDGYSKEDVYIPIPKTDTITVTTKNGLHIPGDKDEVIWLKTDYGNVITMSLHDFQKLNKYKPNDNIEDEIEYELTLKKIRTRGLKHKYFKIDSIDLKLPF